MYDEIPRDISPRFNIVVRDGPYEDAFAYRIPIFIEEKSVFESSSNYSLLLGSGRSLRLQLDIDGRTLGEVFDMLSKEHFPTVVMERNPNTQSGAILESDISFVSAWGSRLKMTEIVKAFREYKRAPPGTSYRSHPSTAQALGLPMCRELFMRPLSRLQSPTYRPDF